MLLCLVMGVLGSVLPFMGWFNDIEYRVCVTPQRLRARELTSDVVQNYRISFFLALAFSSLAPLAYLAYLYSVSEMFSFMRMYRFPRCSMVHRRSHKVVSQNPSYRRCLPTSLASSSMQRTSRSVCLRGRARSTG